MQKPSRLGRPPDRKNEIFTTLLQRIVLGEYLPGSRLPTRRDLCKEFDASPATGQAAFADLKKSGFIKSQGRLGTFVQMSPPHLHRHAIISFASESSDTRVYDLLRNEAAQMKKEGWALDIFDLPRPPRRNELLWSIDEKVRSHQYAGVVFLRSPHHLMDTQLVMEPGIPRVLMTDDLKNFPGYYGSSPALLSDFFQAAAKEILHMGKKRVGLFMHAHTDSDRQDALTILRAAGLEVQSAWAHSIHFSGRWEGLHITELMFMLPPEKRPEIFLVSDDNLTEQITLGVQRFAPPGDIPPVISLCNYPRMPEIHVPVRWIGYDLRDFYLAAFRMIENARRNIPNPHQLVRTPPKTEEQLISNRQTSLERMLVR